MAFVIDCRSETIGYAFFTSFIPVRVAPPLYRCQARSALWLVGYLKYNFAPGVTGRDLFLRFRDLGQWKRLSDYRSHFLCVDQSA